MFLTLINNLYLNLKKKQRIRRLFKNKEYALLFAFYRNELPLFKEGVVICHLKLYRLFLIEPKWRSSIFFILGLFATGKQTNLENTLELLSKYRKNRFILSLFAPYIPRTVKSFLEKDGNQKSLFFASLCAFTQDFKSLNTVLYNIAKTEEAKNPQYFLLHNFLEKNDNAKLNNLNKFLQSYKLECVALSENRTNSFISDLRNIKNITCSCNTDKVIPLVSILVTTYNSQDYIENTLYSLLEQSYPNIEILVVDDNSTDNTYTIVKRIANAYPNIKVFTLENNVGTYIAKNIAMKYAQGELITCHDSDDWAHPRKIELQVELLLKNPKLVATFSKWVRLDMFGQPYTHYIYPLLRLNPSSALFRRKLIEDKIGLWEQVRIGADSEFNARLQLSFGVDRFYIINKPLTFGAHRHNSLMTNVDTGYKDGFSSQREHYSFIWNCRHINQLRTNKNLKLQT